MQYPTHSDTQSGALCERVHEPALTVPTAWDLRSAISSVFVRGGMFLAANLHDGPANAMRAVFVAVVLAIVARISES